MTKSDQCQRACLTKGGLCDIAADREPRKTAPQMDATAMGWTSDTPHQQ